ncbi:MAG: M23 family metallopeptidase [Gammaproteobacteria bacterium]|nr:M23 family metallopeptidase [Gammaproteobacteria bacterium]
MMPITVSFFIGLVATLWMVPLFGASLQLDGNLVQGGLVQGRTLSGARVEFEGRAIRVSDRGLFLLGFGRDVPKRQQLTVILPDGHRHQTILEISQRDYRIQRINGLSPNKVNPSTKALERIRTEVALVKEARRLDDPRTDFLEGFIWPLTGKITGVYGSQRILNGQPKRPHYGVDIAAPKGTVVRAPADGVITLTHPDMYFSGGTLILDHGHGLSSSFLHLGRIQVKEGQIVRQGDVIAEVGATGRSTGAHLDWRINLFAARLDPQLLVEPM